MPSLVLDLEASEPLQDIVVPPPYDAVHALLRWRGIPVGAAWLEAEAGLVSRARLDAALVRPAQPRIDVLLVEAWLHAQWPCRAASSATTLPRMTVAICTRDRADDLARCLAAVCALPDDGQDVLVVDSASVSDCTRDVVAAHPRVRYLRNDVPGLDRARNRVMREAYGDVVAFIDDDAVPDHGWLRALREEFADVRVMGVTGLATPLELETPAQEWFERTNGFARGFARTVFDGAVDDAFFVARIGAGVNMALRRDILRRIGSFDEALGAGTPTKAGDEHDMFTRILAAGYSMVYQPAALVRHRHRRTWPELHDAVRGYGTGVYAYLTRQLLHGEMRAPYVAARWLAAQLRDLARGTLMSAHRTRASLVLSELSGCAVGPLAYLRTSASVSPVDTEPPEASSASAAQYTEASYEAHHAARSALDAMRIADVTTSPASEFDASWPRISVVILTHNRRDRLMRLLTAVAAADYPLARAEVIVVANGCTDGTVEMLESLSSSTSFHIETLWPGRTPAAARNCGVARATGELLLFLDDDIEPSAQLLHLHAACFRAGVDRVLIGAPIPVRVTGAAGLHEIAMWSWWEARLAQMQHPGHRFTYDDLFTGVVSMPAALFARVGGFDGAFACREDSELGVRLLVAGARFCFSRDAGGLHHGLRDARRLALRKRAEGLADVQLARKHVALWSALRIALPLQPVWTPMGVMRRLAFLQWTQPLVVGLLQSLLTTCERLRARASWRAVHGALVYYCYWRGVADSLTPAALRGLEANAAHAAATVGRRALDIDVAEGLRSSSQRIDAERPDEMALTFNGIPLGILSAQDGAEPLRGAHLRAALVRDHASAIAAHLF